MDLNAEKINFRARKPVRRAADFISPADGKMSF